MKKTFIAYMLLISSCTFAQTTISKYKPGVTTDGAVYYLPKTALRIAVQIEKTTYTPGEFSKYAERYLKMNDVSIDAKTTYKVNDIAITAVGVADTSKCFAVKFNAKSAASNISLSDDGVLLAINAKPIFQKEPQPFVASPKKSPINPKQYLKEDILAAGSKAKMAELTAQEIYDIRDSKSQLTRGEADFMPKDGEQLKIMLANLDLQDNVLSSMFTGTISKDTTEHIFTICPSKTSVGKDILFRLSNRLGIVDKDDLSGVPYYISIIDENVVPSTPISDNDKKKAKEKEDGIYVNIPGKITTTISKDNKQISKFEIIAGQFGNTELLSGELFNKKYTTHVTINPVTGAVSKMDAEQPK